MLQEKWVGLLHHVTNEHEWLFGECEHEALTGPPTDTNGQEIAYFSPQEPAFQVLRKIVTDRRWLESLKSYTRFRYCQYCKLHQLTLLLIVGTLDYWNHFIVFFWDTAPKELPSSKSG